jgi:methylmalonyl-CoA/ethylmalonyl-CoA epimerase
MRASYFFEQKMTRAGMNEISGGAAGSADESATAPSPRAFVAPYRRIDHIALAVSDIEQAIALFQNILGFELKRRLHVAGAHTGMLSAEFEANGIRFVICQGTEPESQVSRLVENFGVGLAHIALEVDDVDETVGQLRGKGLEFDTSVIRGPGLTQAFSSRCGVTGLSFEFINRHGAEGFVDANIHDLFRQLEQSGKF